jgi:hypothetical protein
MLHALQRVLSDCHCIWLCTSELFIASLSEGPQDVEGAAYRLVRDIS